MVLGVCLAGYCDAVSAHVLTQRLGYQHGAISLLIVFDQSQPRASDGEAGAIERMHKRAFASFRLGANTGAARLKRFAIRTGTDLAESCGGRQPHFEVVSLGG